MTSCAVCPADFGDDPHFVGLDEAPVCGSCCPTCNPCPRCDGMGWLPCACDTTGDCTCALWECPECHGTGLPSSSDSPLLDGSDAGTVACGGPTTAVPATSDRAVTP